MEAMAGLPVTFGRPGNADPSGKNGTHGMSCSRHRLEHWFGGPVEDAVEVLHARDADGQRLAELAGGDVAEPDAADLAGVAQSGQLGELAVEVDPLVALGGQAGPGVEAPQVHDAELLGAECREVGVDLGAQLLRPLRGDERAAAVIVRAHFAHQDQVVRVGRQGVADEPVAGAAP